jgi:hypothetical protein
MAERVGFEPDMPRKFPSTMIKPKFNQVNCKKLQESQNLDFRSTKGNLLRGIWRDALVRLRRFRGGKFFSSGRSGCRGHARGRGACVTLLPVWKWAAPGHRHSKVPPIQNLVFGIRKLFSGEMPYSYAKSRCSRGFEQLLATTISRVCYANVHPSRGQTAE